MVPGAGKGLSILINGSKGEGMLNSFMKNRERRTEQYQLKAALTASGQGAQDGCDAEAPWRFQNRS